MSTVIDDKITKFIAGKPWLGTLLTVMMALLGAARGRGWFARRFNL